MTNESVRSSGGSTATLQENGALSVTVMSHLDRLFASGEFSRAHLVKRMLRFLVERKLAGCEIELTERNIATQVFERGSDWDSRIDPVVRLTALRLRAKLDGYYDSVGRDDRVRISVPKGQYAPVIEVKAPLETMQNINAAFILQHKPRTSHTAVWATCAVVGILMFAFWVRHRFNGMESTILPVTPISAEFGTQFAPALSPDGMTVAYVGDGDGRNLDIYIKNLRDGKTTRLTTNPDADLNPAWSPDGRLIAFIRVHDHLAILIVVPLSNPKSEQVLTSFRAEKGKWVGDTSTLLGNPGPEWSPDGKSLIISVTSDDGSSHSISSISVQTGARRQLTHTGGDVHDFYPRVSPDGRHLAFARYTTHGIGEIYVANADGSQVRVLTSDLKTIQGISWKSDSRTLLFASNRTGSFQLWSISIQGGRARQLALNSSSAAQPAVRGDKLLFVEALENWNIWKSEIVHGTASEPVRLISSSGRNYDPRVSPDGKTIAFVSDRSGGWQIWLADLNGNNLRQLTRLSVTWLGSPSWSPDGQRIIFDARPDDHSGIYVVEVPKGTVNVIEKTRAQERSPSWSRDGRSIYFNSNRDGITAVYRKDLVTGRIIRITQPDVFGSSESFDGKTLYFNTQHGSDLWRENVDGSEPTYVTGTPHLFPPMAWSVFSRGIYFASDDDNAEQYSLYSLIGGRVSIIGKTNAPIVPYTPSLGASPNGQTLLFAEQDQIRSNLKMSLLTGR